MKAVIIFAVALAAVAGALALDAATDKADAVSEFNTHDADALEVEFEASEESGMEVADAAVETAEAELVDADAAAEAESVEFEDQMDDAAEESEHDAQADTVSDMDAAADELDSDAADQAVEDAEMEASQEGEHNVERNFKSLTEADLNLAVDSFEALKARGCTPETNIKCPDGSLVFSKIQAQPDFNGCGPAGARILNDNTLGGKFSPCCNNHDLCYARPAAKKDACDASFYSCMKDVCAGGLFCKGRAWVYYQAVSMGGCPAWKASRLRKGCKTGILAANNPTYNVTTKATVAQTEAASKFFSGAGTGPAKVAAPAAKKKL